MELIEYPDREIMAMDVANKLAGELASALLNHDAVTLVVPGGTTPQATFEMLSGASVDWSRVRVMPSDERFVPESDPRSNAAMIRAHFLTDRAAAASFVPIAADTETPEDAIGERIAGVEAALPIHIAVLGMGADMHTASLFPGADRLSKALAEDPPSLMAMRVPGHDVPRITLTPSVLKEAMSTHILITGDDKRKAVEKARKLPPERAPVAALLRGATVHWAA